MPVTVACECGHVTELADRDQPAEGSVAVDQVCAACGRPLRLPPPAGKRMFQQLWQSHVGEEPFEPARPIAEESSAPRRSLWDVMRGSNESASTTSSQRAPTEESVAPAAPKPKGLWDVMHAV